MRMRHALTIVASTLIIAALAACSGSGDDAATTGTATRANSDTSSRPSPAASEAPAATGCAATGETVPQDAAIGTTADLDGDGQPDRLWLADAADGTRTLGVETASGAVFSADFTSAAPQAASAIGQVLGDGTAIVLLDAGRAVPLYAVVDCGLVATQNEQGEQYTFDKGFTGYGTGVGCEDGDAGLGLVGYRAMIDGDAADVTSTLIELAGGGRTATAGESSTQTGLPSDAPLVTTATSVSCGDNEPPVDEPQA